MASIILPLEPPPIVPVNNPVLYRVFGVPLSDLPWMRITISYYLPGSTTTQVITSWEQQPIPGPYAVFNFNISQVLQDHLSYMVHSPNTSAILSPPETIKRFKIEFEGFKLSGGNKVSSSNKITKNIWGINACLQENEANLNAYLMDGSQKSFLTRGPSEKEIRPGESEVLSLLTNNNQGVFEMKIVAYDAHGTPATMIKQLNTLLAAKRIDVPVGMSNITQQWPLFLNNKVKYEVVVEPDNINLFREGDNGTFDQNINNIVPGTGVLLSRTTARKLQGSASMKMQLYDSVSTIEKAWESGMYTLFPNTYYEFQAIIYVEQLNGPSWALVLEKDGFSDATIIGTDHGKVYIHAWHQNNAADYFNKWIPLTLAFTTGNDTSGKFRMLFSGTMSTLNVFVDEVTLKGNVAAAKKITYHIKPVCGHETRVHFLNRLGAMDSYTFNGAERRNIKTESSTYQRLKPHGSTPTARGRQVLQKASTVRLSCSSDALRPEEMLWLEELLTSPAVYVQRGNQNIPVILRDGEFEVVDPVKNIHRLRVELEYANDMVLQRG